MINARFRSIKYKNAARTEALAAFLLWVVCYMSFIHRIEILFLSCYQTFDDGIGKAIP